MTAGLESKRLAFIDRVIETVPAYLDALKDTGRPGRFFPCARGRTPLGGKLVLGFSCLALKTYYILGLWDRLEPGHRREWLDLIKSFQTGERHRNPLLANSFSDPALVADLGSTGRKASAAFQALRHPRTWWRNRAKAGPISALEAAVIAETKQAISSLVQVGDKPDRPYEALLALYPRPKEYIEKLDWTTPWRAGGQAAAVVVFARLGKESASDTEIPYDRWLTDSENFYAGICDPDTGSYFTGARPGYTQLVNGAMKVLTALDWLEIEIHRPERLIDTVLSSLPEPGGCHMVDSVYVLHQCLGQVEYRRKDIIRYCNNVVEMLAKHRKPDGGFSYQADRNADIYYGVKFAEGLDISDLHGTSLLCWAISMILDLCQVEDRGLKNLRP